MKYLAGILLVVSAVVVADKSDQRHHGGSQAWVQDFENLVAIGDRKRGSIPLMTTSLTIHPR
jgi:hypothetical protein